jgi:hypothetical protein
VEVERHSRSRQIELAHAIAGRRKIYLDLRFWIMLRDVALGLRSEEKLQTLLMTLRRGVASGTMICPISAPTFLELMKQPFLAERRIATANLVDELSLGVSIMRGDRIMRTEVDSFALRVAGRSDVHRMWELVWTKAAYVLGDVYPVPQGLPPEMAQRIQVEFFDHLWSMSLGKMIGIMGEASIPPDSYTSLSKETNANCQTWSHEITSYKAAYDIELRGVVEEMGPVASQRMVCMAEAAIGRPLDANERSQFDNPGKNALYYGMRMPKWRRLLRSMHIDASIHASMRWDKSRNFKPNDWYDFQHATAAVGYCDIFLTERSMHHLLTRPQMALDGVSKCRVAFDPADALAAIEAPEMGRMA